MNPSQSVGSASLRSRRRRSNDPSGNRSITLPRLLPSTNSSSRNCADWKPLADSRRSRKDSNSTGVIVSRMSSWATSTLSTVSTRFSVAAARAPSPATNSARTRSSSCSTTLNHSS